MVLSERAAAELTLAGAVCDALGGLYLAYDVFRRHAGPLGFLTRAATYCVVLAIPAWIAFGAPFGAITGAGLGSLIAGEYWGLARRQRLQRSSPLSQPWWSGAARGAIIGFAAIPRFGRYFGLMLAASETIFLALVYGLGVVPTFRFTPGRFGPTRHALRGAAIRAAAFGVGAAAAGLIVAGPGAAERFGSLIALLVAFSGVAIVAIVPSVEYWIEHAGDSFFVFAGLTLLFFGLVCDSIPEVVVLFR